ncbi:hypothetical protein GCM10011391_20470 [Pullulanibacillus camelliae]|uniref:Uncharacterized protein n=1 Tax=Pullulanibacillus camelliae TaxID=1707096 RepID=A0A8J2VZ77_9BACL|nr:hypothetical protein [Pullulanibacillus camelliae]GGE41603.1 hypothetical protein GCM10011391_20470 [Pullulanibacillus camelliae]
MSIPFTYEQYRSILKRMKKQGYHFIDFLKMNQVQPQDKAVILRHDIDFSLEKAVKMAKLEHELGITSTFFILIHSGFYNPLSLKSQSLLRTIHSYGHQFGLHFDDSLTEGTSEEELKAQIIHDAEFLAAILKTPIHYFSFHRPSERLLQANLDVTPLINAYSQPFFKDISYISDSRKRWRQMSLEQLIEQEAPQRLQVLIHPIWWSDEPLTFEESLTEIVQEQLKDMRSDFEAVLAKFPLEVMEPFGLTIPRKEAQS